MPYILLALGLLIGLYALYRFFLNANVAQIKALFLAVLLFALSVALFFMAVTGRLAAALALMVALAPVMLSTYKTWKAARAEFEIDESTEIRNRADALKVLDLDEDADEDTIEAAYKRLMQKVHPDVEGSQWMAAKLNQARDILRDQSER